MGYDDVAQIHILVAIAQTLASEDLDDFWHSQRDFAVVLLMGALRNEHSTSSVKKGAWILLRTLNESLVRRRATRFVAHGRSIAAADVERAVAEMPEGAWTTKVRIADEKIRDQWGLERVDYVISPQRLGS